MVVFRRTNRRRPDRRQRIQNLQQCVRSIVRRAVPMALLAVIATGLPYLIFQAYIYTVSNTYFAIKDVSIEGLVYAQQEEVLELGQLYAGRNIFDVDVHRLEMVLMQHPFIKHAQVSRRLPDKVFIEIDEFIPVAIIVDESFVLVDGHGVAFKVVDAHDPVDELLELPIITGLKVGDLQTDLGREQLGHALHAVRVYEQRGLHRMQRLSEVHVDAVMGLAFVTEDSGTEIRLGWGRYDERIERLDAVLNSLMTRRIEADYILIDQEGDLSRVAVGTPLEPRNGNSLHGIPSQSH